MKLMRVGPQGAERPAALVEQNDGSSVIVDLSEVIDDLTPAELQPATLDRVRTAIAEGGLPSVDS